MHKPFSAKGVNMITVETIAEKVTQIRDLDDLVALDNYVDYMIYKEQSNEKTELGQAIIRGLEDILAGRTHKITCAEDVLKVADEV